MTKTILFTLLSAGGSALFAGETFACGGGSCCATTSACAVPSCAAPAGGTAPADPHAGMQMSQGNRGSSYQSFSYEPGASRTGVVAPMIMRRSAPSFYDTIRADKKIRGH